MFIEYPHFFFHLFDLIINNTITLHSDRDQRVGLAICTHLSSDGLGPYSLTNCSEQIEDHCA